MVETHGEGAVTSQRGEVSRAALLGRSGGVWSVECRLAPEPLRLAGAVVCVVLGVHMLCCVTAGGGVSAEPGVRAPDLGRSHSSGLLPQAARRVPAYTSLQRPECLCVCGASRTRLPFA